MINKYRAILLVYLALTVSPVFAEHKHFWEAGAGIGMIHAPFYRGASQSKDYYIPFPFIRFRGKIFAADEDGIRGKIFDSERLKLDFSIAGSVPVPKDTVGARIDMPQLDPIGELGPALQYFFWKNSNNSQSITFELPVRGVFSLGTPFLAHKGWSISPFVNYLNQDKKDAVLWRYSVSAGPLWADQKFHNYFYKVSPQYETADRPAYNASSGYSGSRITFSVSRSSKHMFLGFFARYDDLNGATFVDSPLVETKHYFIMGIAAVWIFAHSDQRAEHYD